jgi:transposase
VPGIFIVQRVAKLLDHLRLYRQNALFARAALPIARSTLPPGMGKCGMQLLAVKSHSTASARRRPT